MTTETATHLVYDVILRRKSARKFVGDALPEGVLRRLIRAGMQAPSAHDKRPWYFIEIDDPEVLKKLADGLPFAQMIPSARHAIMVLGDKERAAVEPGGDDYWVQDCSAASENILLAAESLGLGACWTVLHPMEDRVAHARVVMGIPPTAIPLCLIAVGYTAGLNHAKDKFDPKRIFSNHWGVEPPNPSMKP
jgi:nitroreductase